VNNFYAFRSRNDAAGFASRARRQLCLRDLNKTAPAPSPWQRRPGTPQPGYSSPAARQTPSSKPFFADRAQKHFFNGAPMTPAVAALRPSAPAPMNHQPLPASRPAGHASPGANQPSHHWSNWHNAVAEKMSSHTSHSARTSCSTSFATRTFRTVTAPRFSINGGEVPSGTSLTLSNAQRERQHYYTPPNEVIRASSPAHQRFRRSSLFSDSSSPAAASSRPGQERLDWIPLSRRASNPLRLQRAEDF